MNSNQQDRLNALYDRIRFINRHADLLGALRTSPAYLAVERIACTVTALAGEQREAQAEFVRHTRLKCEHRDTLWQQHMRPIVAIARACLTLSPRLAELTPDGVMRDGECADAAEAMASAASHHRSSFTRQALPDTFVVELRAAAKALRDAMAAQFAIRMRVTGATKQIATQLSAGHAEAKLLDSLVVSRIWKNEELLAAYCAAKRVTTPWSPSACVERAA